MIRWSLWWLVAMVVPACVNETTGGGGGTPDATEGGGADTVPPGDAGLNSCAERGRYIYTFDDRFVLSAFSPETLAFTDIGPVLCATSSIPQSMAVDRQGSAWVHYQSGEIFKVSLADASCDAASRVDLLPLGLITVGMGFSTDVEGQANDTLFVADYVVSGAPDYLRLSTLDPAVPSTTEVGEITGPAELTGTGDARLYGYYPFGPNPRVAELSKTTGAEIRELPTPGLAGGGAYAFAFWGDAFWLFYQGSGSTEVHRLDRTTGAVTLAVPDTGREIVGAGVSTCAPVSID